MVGMGVQLPGGWHPWGVDEVWVTLIGDAHGENTVIEGVYEDREAAFEGLKKQRNMTVWVGDDGFVHGRPKRESRPALRLGEPWFPVRWAVGRPLAVQRR